MLKISEGIYLLFFKSETQEGACVAFPLTMENNHTAVNSFEMQWPPWKPNFITCRYRPE